MGVNNLESKQILFFHPWWFFHRRLSVIGAFVAIRMLRGIFVSQMRRGRLRTEERYEIEKYTRFVRALFLHPFHHLLASAKRSTQLPRYPSKRVRRLNRPHMP